MHHGDALTWLQTLPDSSVDALITDPPYASGGLHAGDRKAAPARWRTDTARQKTLPLAKMIRSEACG